MPGASYTALNGKKQQLIRRSRDGSCFAAPTTATGITALTDSTTKLLNALPAGWSDLGWLTDDGMQFSSDIDTSDVTSFGSVTPTRTDINSESTELQVSCQETNLMSIGLYVGVATGSITADGTSGEVQITKPLSPIKQSYRILSVSVDNIPQGEVYVCRYWPNAEVTDKDDQAFNKEDPLMWPVTLSARPDSTVGFAERWLFGGPGWFALLDDMGIESDA